MSEVSEPIRRMRFDQNENKIEKVRVPVLDVLVSQIRLRMLVEYLTDLVSIGSDQSVVIVGHNLHSVYISKIDSEFASLYERADLVLCDGFPIYFLASLRLLFRRGRVQRLGSTDWLPSFLLAQEALRVAVVGGSAESNLKCLEFFKNMNPKLEAVGVAGLDWSDEKTEYLLVTLENFRPQLCLIGLGMPLQEKTLMSIFDLLPKSIYALVGGAIDQFSGVQMNAPRFLGSIGFEWIWRLATQPRRLSGRYLIEPFHLVRVLVKKWKE